MKLLLTLSFIIASILTMAQTDCKPYLPGDVGKTWEITSYSAKDKVTGRVTHEILSVSETDSSTTYEVKSVFYDKKDEQTYESTYEAECVNGIFHLDMTVMMDGNAMAAYEDMDAEVDATEFELPPTDASAVGPLEDGTLNISVSTNGMNVMNMTVEVTDRKVEGLEEITTDAGTFNCLKLSQNVSTKMVFKIEASSIEWYSEGVGMVRSESYNSKGKLTGYSVLTKLD
ncbi:MAG: hypothetical protein NXI10_01360 [bacterium]|nr:hypothetical protein [bacterium]